MKGQTLLTTLYCLLFSSSGNNITENKDLTGTPHVKEQKTTTIYHNGQPIHVHGIPESLPHYTLQTLASESVPNEVGPGPKVALQRDKLVIKNENSYLQDSYGNQYHNLPKQMAFKTKFPQQYVALQDLPLHFSPPLLSFKGNKQAYTLPHSTFQDHFNKQSFYQGPSKPVFFDHSKSSVPVVLKQGLNVPIQGHYKIVNSAPITANNQAVTFSFHAPPSQRFINVAPERLQMHTVSQFSYNPQPSSSFLNQKVFFDEPKLYSRPSFNAPAKSARYQEAKTDESEPVITISEQAKSIDPQYFKPQVFSNPIVPQVQHFLPHILNVHKIRHSPVQITEQPKQQQEKQTHHQQQQKQQPEPKKQQQVKQLVEQPQYDMDKKRVIINEYAPPPKHEHKEEIKSEVINEEENDEKNFDEGYHEAAKGFPAFSFHDDYEKKIYDEGSYGEPAYHDSLPFGPPDDDEHRNSAKIVSTVQHNAYGGDNDHNKEEKFKPVPYYSNEKKFYSSNKHENNPSGKYTKYHDGPKYSSKIVQHEQEFPVHFGGTHLHSGDHSHHHSSPPELGRYELDYSKSFSQPPSDRHRHSAHSPRSNNDSPTTRFIEPQYQYGFEPITARIGSVEPFVSASNISPESEERPSSMKKIYKENWSISKISSSEAGSDDS